MTTAAPIVECAQDHGCFMSKKTGIGCRAVGHCSVRDAMRDPRAMSGITEAASRGVPACQEALAEIATIRELGAETRRAEGTESFAMRLRAAMVCRDVSSVKIASLTGVTRAAVSKWTTGKGFPSSSTLILLCDCLGVTRDWIMELGPVRP